MAIFQGSPICTESTTSTTDPAKPATAPTRWLMLLNNSPLYTKHAQKPKMPLCKQNRHQARQAASKSKKPPEGGSLTLVATGSTDSRCGRYLRWNRNPPVQI